RSSARNTGISKCTKDIILCIDQDIILNLNFINILYSQIAHFYWNNFLAIGTVHNLEPIHGLKLNSGEIPIYKFNHWLDSVVQPFDGFHLFLAEEITSDWVCSNNLSFKRHSWHEMGLQFDEEYDGWGEEDVDLGYQGEIKGFKIIRFKCLSWHAIHRIKVEKNSHDFSRNILRLFSKYPKLISRQYGMLTESGSLSKVIPSMKIK
ncbi:MAG: hypothetical protein WC375_11490, partial [Methanomassiliicoccales archaeon]